MESQVKTPYGKALKLIYRFQKTSEISENEKKIFKEFLIKKDDRIFAMTADLEKNFDCKEKRKFYSNWLKQLSLSKAYSSISTSPRSTSPRFWSPIQRKKTRPSTLIIPQMLTLINNQGRKSLDKAEVEKILKSHHIQ